MFMKCMPCYIRGFSSGLIVSLQFDAAEKKLESLRPPTMSALRCSAIVGKPDLRLLQEGFELMRISELFAGTVGYQPIKAVRNVIANPFGLYRLTGSGLSGARIRQQGMILIVVRVEHGDLVPCTQCRPQGRFVSEATASTSRH